MDFVFIFEVAEWEFLKYFMSQYIIISKGTELLRFPIDLLVYIESDGNYSYVVTHDGRKALVTMQLGQLEDILNSQLGDNVNNIVRLGRGLIINTNYVHQIDIARQRLVLSDCDGCWHELSASRIALTQLKTLIDKADD